MPNQVTISGITGTSPYNVYTCDVEETTCIYVDTVGGTDLPYTFNVPLIFEPLSSVNVKITDNINREFNQIIIF
jgi:hypothetical protein